MTFFRTPLNLLVVLSLAACVIATTPEVSSDTRAVEVAKAPPKWGFILAPIDADTEDSDGTLRVWHSRIGRQTYSTKSDCLEAAKEGLEYLGEEAWNYEAKCQSPPRQNTPIATMPFNSETKNLDRQTLNQLCLETGGIAGNFGDQGENVKNQSVGNKDAFETLLDPIIAPFLTFERWYTPSGAISTLRYIAPTTELINQQSLTDMLESLAQDTGWDRIPEPSRGWYKLVGTDSAPDLLMLFSDGGLTSTSLYCVRRAHDQLNASQREYVSKKRMAEQ